MPGGANRIRTGDPMHAMHVLYQLSYSPKNLSISLNFTQTRQKEQGKYMLEYKY
jgi:hypothetical protein